MVLYAGSLSPSGKLRRGVVLVLALYSGRVKVSWVSGDMSSSIHRTVWFAVGTVVISRLCSGDMTKVPLVALVWPGAIEIP